MSLALSESRILNSPVGRWDARWKLAAVVVIVGVFVAISDVILASVALGISATVAGLARISARDYFARLLLVGFGLIPIWLVCPFTADNGLSMAATLTMRAWAVAGIALALVKSAPPAHTLAAAHRLFIPGLLVQVALLAYRYSFLFLGESRRTRIALRTRAFRPATNWHTYRTTGQAVGSLLVRGGDRAEAVADAMRTRGFRGEFHSIRPFHTGVRDVAAFAVAVLIGAALAIAEWR